MTAQDAVQELLKVLEGFLLCQAPDGTKCSPNNKDFDFARRVISKYRGIKY